MADEIKMWPHIDGDTESDPKPPKTLDEALGLPPPKTGDSPYGGRRQTV